MEKNDACSDHFEAVVLANGDYPTVPTPLEILQQTPIVVCCDGAANEFIRQKHTPYAIVGDGDSLNEHTRELYKEKIHTVGEQETNDLTKAVRFLQNQGIRKIAILGATGKREDHTLGNISLLMKYFQEGVEVKMFTDYGVFVPCYGTATFNSQPGQQVSIFSFSARNFNSAGLKYPLYDFTEWWQGTLNECTEDQFTISAEGFYLVFLNYTRQESTQKGSKKVL